MRCADDYYFPTTPHLRGSCGTDDDDTFLDLPTTQRILSSHVLVQEKLDGLNVGVGMKSDGQLVFIQKDRILDELELSQLGALAAWFTDCRRELVKVLGLRFTLFGEYLPDRRSLTGIDVPWVLFDCYDHAARRFVSQSVLRRRTAPLGLELAPTLFMGQLNNIAAVKKLIGRSHFGPGSMEGVYLRLESAGFLRERYKFVRREYVKPS